MTKRPRPYGFLLGVLIVTSFFPLRPAGANPCDESDPCSQYLVKLTRTAPDGAALRLAGEHGLLIEEKFEDTGIYHLVGDLSRPEGEVLEALNADPDVLYAEPNYEIQANVLPDDPWFPKLWGLHNIGQERGTPGADLGMDDVWDYFNGSSSVVVAVLDSGVDYKHQDLAANIWVNQNEIAGNRRDDDGNGYVDDVHGFNFYRDTADPMDDYFHGTHVAGTIGAVGDNGIGVTGVNWRVRLMALKFMGADGKGSLSDAIRAIQYAVKNGAKIINNSWSFTYPGLASLPSSPSLEPVQSLRDAIQKADEAGVIFVAASGNSGANNDVVPTYPSSYSVANILSVGATDAKDALPAFSNYGAKTVDLAAPGSVIFSTWPTWKENPPYHHLSGTSMSAPHVAGAAALLWGAEPKLTHRQVIDRILQGVQPLPAWSGKSLTGGRLDVSTSFSMGNPFINHPPVAYAGPNQLRRIGDTVLLQGRATDQDGDSPLTYRWRLSVPLGSRTVLVNSTRPTASFFADVKGTYTATLVASDGKASSLAATAKVYVLSAITQALKLSEDGLGIIPVVSAMREGAGEVMDPALGGQVGVGEAIILDASSSVVPDGEEVSYDWTLMEKPVDSLSELDFSEGPSSSFVPDLEGRYTVQMTLSAGKWSSTDEISFVAMENPTGGAGEGAEEGDDGLGASESAAGGCALKPAN